MEVRAKPIRSLMDAARKAGSGYLEVYRGGLPILMQPPRIIGPGKCFEVAGTSRTVFAAAFENPRLRPKSNFLELKHELLLDYQGPEFDAIPLDLEYDAAVLGRRGTKVLVSNDYRDAPLLTEPEVLSLVGFTAQAFGHWMLEYLLQWVTASELPELRGLPVLIDDGMPASHRQALEYFSNGRADVIVAPSQGTFRVAKLWKVSNWIYVPLRPLSEDALDPRFMVSPAAKIAERYNRLGRRVEEDLEYWGGPKRIFLSRRKHLHRKLMNIGRVEELASARGFHIVYPEDLPFADQARLVRGATHILGPEGSALFLAFLARPGTRVCCLDHPFVEKVSSVTTIFSELRLDFTLLTGRCVRKDETFARFSDYEIAEADLLGLLSEWGIT